jgi:hypothetical protein
VQDTFKLAIVILLFINLAACSALPDDKPPVDISSTATPNNLESPTGGVNQNWVIVTRKQAEEIASWLGGSGGFWTPSADDIFKLEERLAEYLSQNSSYFYRQPPVWEQLDEYQRQYIGLERGDRQIIYGNFFCNNLGMDWRQKLVIVEDGGDCYFQVEYDVESEVFIKLLVNGVS